MRIVGVDASNVDSEHVCCAIGNDRENKARAETKKAWLRERFAEGLRFRRLDERGKVFVEYLPMDAAWKPVSGGAYMMIDCLWVSGKFKGQGWSRKLLEECLRDARDGGMDGVAVVTGNKAMPFLTDRKFYLNAGFAKVGEAPPYFELLALKFRKDAPDPAFTGNARTGACPVKKGVCFIYSNQCPFMEEYVGLLSGVCAARGVPFEARKLKSAAEAKKIGSPFGTLGIWRDGVFLTHELMTEAKFAALL